MAKLAKLLLFFSWTEFARCSVPAECAFGTELTGFSLDTYACNIQQTYNDFHYAETDCCWCGSDCTGIVKIVSDYHGTYYYVGGGPITAKPGNYSVSVTLRGECAWSSWLDRDDPTGTGDYENRFYFSDDQIGCENPENIQCRDKNSQWMHYSTGDIFAEACTLDGGIECRNSDQNGGICKDYESRYLCCFDQSRCTSAHIDVGCCTEEFPCDFGQGDCNNDSQCNGSLNCVENGCGGPESGWPEFWDCCGVADDRRECTWSDWINIDSDQSDTGDHERHSSEVIPCNDPQSIECRHADSRVPHDTTGQVFDVSCTLDGGLVCSNNNNPGDQCLDYEVRYMCCETPFIFTIPDIIKPDNGVVVPNIDWTLIDLCFPTDTVEDGPCIFPFYYEGTQYTRCALIDTPDGQSGSKWCATRVDEFLYVVPGYWGLCKDCDDDDKKLKLLTVPQVSVRHIAVGGTMLVLGTVIFFGCIRRKRKVYAIRDIDATI